MRESELEKKVGDFCKREGVRYYKFSSPSRRGVPDRICLYKGKIAFLELKAEGKKPTKLQARELEILRRGGFHAEYADTLDSAKAFLCDALGVNYGS